MSCKWLNDSSVNSVVVGQVLAFLYLSITVIISDNEVSGNSGKITSAISLLLLELTKSRPFWIAFVKFSITSGFFSK